MAQKLGHNASDARKRRLQTAIDRAEPVAVVTSLAALAVAGVIGPLWTSVGDVMKQGLAVALLVVPLLFLYRSIHKQTTALTQHVAEGARRPMTSVPLYEGLRALAEIEYGRRPDVLLLARSGERYLGDLRNIDPRWGTLRVVLTHETHLDLWRSRPRDRGWATDIDIRLSSHASDVTYLMIGNDHALIGFFLDAGDGTVDYANSVLVAADTGHGRELLDALRRHFNHRFSNAEPDGAPPSTSSGQSG